MIADNQTTDRIIRLSLGWLIFAALAVILLGLAGGFLAAQMVTPPRTPLINDGQKFVATVQEVTISPNTAAADIVSRTNRSVVLIGRPPEEKAPMLGTGFVVTNDGVVMSTIPGSGSSFAAYDQDGRVLPLQKIGRDDIFGLTYFRLNNNVVAPLDLRQDAAPIGYTLLALSRNDATFLSRVETYTVTDLLPPPAGTPLAVQRLMKGQGLSHPASLGAPLLDDAGRVAAIILDVNTSTALDVGHIQTSLQRIVDNKRELNPFTTLGIILTYDHERVRSAETIAFAPTVASVTPGNPAANAGLEVGDIITAIQSTPVAWHQSVTAQLSATLPLELKVLREGEEHTLILQPVTGNR